MFNLFKIVLYGVDKSNSHRCPNLLLIGYLSKLCYDGDAFIFRKGSVEVKLKLKLLFIVLTIGLLLIGCSGREEASKEVAPKSDTIKSETTTPKNETVKPETTAPKSEKVETKKNTIKTDVFEYAKKVDITDARDINKHVTAIVFMSDELTLGLATQHVLNQSYNFLQQADLESADTVTIGVMQGEKRVFQCTVTMKNFVPNDSIPMADVVLKASKVEKIDSQVQEFANAIGWTIIK